jgi:type IV pilus assembly protein PilW
MAGVSLVEMMIAVTLGLLILAALASIFASTSHSRNEIERNSRQIENGRYAMEILSEEFRMAGFYGELNTAQVMKPAAIPDPCSTDPVVWKSAVPMHVYGWDEGLNVPPCIPLANHKPRTDVVMFRRVATCEAGAVGCNPFAAGQPYVQVSRCAKEQVITPYELGITGSATGWNLQMKDCSGANTAGVRQYIVRIYYISLNNGADAIPTLRRLDFDGARFNDTALVEGIEELNIEYGIDWAPVMGPLQAADGKPEGYTTDPVTYTTPDCAGWCSPVQNWLNVTTARIHLLSRNIEPSPDYEDKKIYTLGSTAGGGSYDVTPGGAFRRHAYSSLVRVVNAAQRREQPS